MNKPIYPYLSFHNLWGICHLRSHGSPACKFFYSNWALYLIDSLLCPNKSFEAVCFWFDFLQECDFLFCAYFKTCNYLVWTWWWWWWLEVFLLPDYSWWKRVIVGEGVLILDDEIRQLCFQVFQRHPDPKLHCGWRERRYLNVLRH